MKGYLQLCLMALPLLPVVAAGARPDGTETSGERPAAHNHRGPKQLMLENADGAVIRLWKPDLTTLPLQPSHGSLTLPPTGMDNYHALVAEQTWNGGKEALIRYEYLFGKPSQHSPSELTSAVKTEFEIVPSPIPREHYRYLSDHRWGFQLRLHGRSLADHPLTLETEHGSRLQAVTDEQGYAVFRLPDDFPDVVAGERDQRSAEFTVSAAVRDNDTDYRTSLSASYRIDPAHWQSASLGWAVAGLGLVAGGLLGRQRNSGGKAA